ncbi:hypothetical protein LSAT2_027268 [Lamellibrachia satsuma]|nr:hypothetical protein LSAT2_027268 [Lamellibrachia satsuma]
MASLPAVVSLLLLLLVASGLAAPNKFCIFNRHHFKPLQVIPTTSACKYCVCSEDTLEPVCFLIQCPAPACSNPVFESGRCCAMCPGPKTECLVDGVTIEAGQSMTMPLSSKCYKICVCPNGAESGVGVQAACTRVCRVF